MGRARLSESTTSSVVVCPVRVPVLDSGGGRWVAGTQLNIKQ